MRFKIRKARSSTKTTDKSELDAKVPVVAPGDYSIRSYSQEGEDVVLRRFLKTEKPGFYVDVGAHHPERFSNTLYYYNLGWSGINVDADPDLMKEFEAVRPRDINVTSAVGNSNKSLVFYVFNERAVNTFDEKLAKERAKIKGWKIVEKRKIPILPLKKILDEHMPEGREIDFISIDVEGQDLEVLKSNDWVKYRPGFVLVECYEIPDLSAIKQNPIIDFMAEQSYIPVAKMLYTVIFANKKIHGKK